jgi:hypothetical protein
MPTAKTSEIQAMTSSRICGHGLELADQAGRPFRAGRCLVALKMVKVVAMRARTIREQEKLTPRSIILAIRTRVLTFCSELALAGD